MNINKKMIKIKTTRKITHIVLPGYPSSHEQAISEVIRLRLARGVEKEKIIAWLENRMLNIWKSEYMIKFINFQISKLKF